MRQIETIAKQQEADKVVGITVRLGALSHMSPAHFQEHFDQVSGGTIAEGAQIYAQVSEDPADPHAYDVLLESIEVPD
jgi:hydrogenase nickel incorporation protein HypA/HybF